eukprot:m.3898 g.3898  ORF g.3898 m.3898 type:complete len:981 (+) comp2848_c0_seq1:431-3373(+)
MSLFLHINSLLSVALLALLVVPTSAVSYLIAIVAFGGFLAAMATRLVTPFYEDEDQWAQTHEIQVLRSNFDSRIKREQKELNMSQHTIGGAVARPAKVDHLLDQCMDLVIRDYVETWYTPIYPYDDPEMRHKLKKIFWNITDELHTRLLQVDFTTLLTRDLVVCLTIHLQGIRHSSEGKFSAHPCLYTREEELRFLRTVSETLLYVLVPKDVKDSDLSRLLFREILAMQLLDYTISMVCDYDYVNQYILYRCRLADEQRQKSKGLYAYAQNHSEFLKLITKTNDLSLLQQIRNHIIAEMMQVRHLMDMRLSQATVREKSGAQIGSPDKAALLNNRNLPRYLNKLEFSKLECERNLAMKGGPDFRKRSEGQERDLASPGNKANRKTTPSSLFNSVVLHPVKLFSTITSLSGESSTTEIEFLSLPDILSGLALGYFWEYLRKARASKNLQFWLVCKSLLEIADKNEDVPCDSVRNVQQVSRLRADDQSRLQIDERTLHMMEAVSCGVTHEVRESLTESGRCNHTVPRTELISFVWAQEQVYNYLYENHYRPFTFSEFYRSYIKHCTQRAASATSRPVSPTLPSSSPKDDIDERELKSGGNPALGDNISASWRMDGALASRAGTDTYIERRRQRLSKEIKKKEDIVPDSGQDESELKQLKAQLRMLEHEEERANEWMSRIGEWEAHIDSIHGESDDLGEETAFIAVNRIDRAKKGWICVRTRSQFEALHSELKQYCDWLPSKLPWKLASKGGLFGASRTRTQEQLEKQRQELQTYLQKIMRDEKLSASEALFQFLNMDQPDSGGMSDERDGMLLSRESDSIAEPMYMLVSEVFELKGAFKWFRKQFVNFVQLAYGRSINSAVKETLNSQTSEENMVEYLTIFRDVVFPEDYEAPEPHTKEEKEMTRDEARKELLANIPDVLKSLVGQDNSRQGTETVFSALQSTQRNKHLLYIMLEKILEHMFPGEVKPRNLAVELVEVDLDE